MKQQSYKPRLLSWNFYFWECSCGNKFVVTFIPAGTFLIPLRTKSEYRSILREHFSFPWERNRNKVHPAVIFLIPAGMKSDSRLYSRSCGNISYSCGNKIGIPAPFTLPPACVRIVWHDAVCTPRCCKSFSGNRSGPDQRWVVDAYNNYVTVLRVYKGITV